jgi:hypothetical protein
MPKVFVCHAEADERSESETISVKFPDAFDKHLAHGDTIGGCPEKKK